MPLDTLNDSEFEGTLLDSAENDNLKYQKKSDDLGTSFKGTVLGQQSSLEKELGLVAEKSPEEKSTSPKSSKKIKTKVKSSSDEFTELYGGLKNYTEGDTVDGIITKIQNGVIFVDIAYKAEGIIEPDELSADPHKKPDLKVGDKISVKIMRLENKAGNPVLSKKRADFDIAWKNLQKAELHHQEIEVSVYGVRDDGLTVDYNHLIRGYVPPSQLPSQDELEINDLVGKTINVKVLKADRKRRKLILSLKKAQHGNLNKKLNEALAKLKPGQTLKGKVTSIKSYGAFINLGELDGLVHISELSWSRIEKVEDLLQVDQEIEVYVLNVNQGTGKISLSIKRLSNDPWSEIFNNYKVGDKIKATITRLMQFGAFASVKDGVEGLIHITELADQQVKYPEEIVKVGQEVQATIIRIDEKNRRLGLSLRENPIIETETKQETESAAEPA